MAWREATLNLIYDGNLSDFNGCAINSRARHFFFFYFPRRISFFICDDKNASLRILWGRNLLLQEKKSFNQPIACNLNKNVIIEWDDPGGSLRWQKSSFVAKAGEWSLTGNGKKSISAAKAFIVFLDQYYDERVSMCTVHTIHGRDDSGRNGKFITKLNDAVKMSIALQSLFPSCFCFSSPNVVVISNWKSSIFYRVVSEARIVCVMHSTNVNRTLFGKHRQIVGAFPSMTKVKSIP